MMAVPRPRRLVLVGSVLVDILLYVDRMPVRGSDLLARRTLTSTGGGFNVLVAASRLGLPAAYAGRVGDGPFGARVAHDLDAAAITRLLPGVSGEDTGFDVGMVEPDGERTFVTSPGCEALLLPRDLARVSLSPDDAVYVSGYDLQYPVSGESLAEWIPALPPGISLALDPGPLVMSIPSDRLRHALARTTLLSVNTREAHLLTGSVDVEAAATDLSQRISPEGWVVVRAGERGCWVGSRTSPAVHISARATRTVDTTGAGDAHLAALLARLARGDTMVDAAWAANLAASISIERRGPATGPTAAELDRVLRGSPRPE